MFEDDRSYYRYRFKVETERAREARSPDAAHAHYQLAQAYRGRLSSLEPDGVREQ